MGTPPPAPLAPGFVERPLWHDGSTNGAGDGRPGRPSPEEALRAAPTNGGGEPGPLPAVADVVVVGGGYCGIAAAGELARRGRHAVVVEADPLGTGASTRNGGMVIPELKHGPRALARRYGPLGGELFDAVLEAFDLVERLVADHGIACDYARSGGLLLAHHEAQVAGLREAVREWSDDVGEAARFIGRDELSDEIGSDQFAAGFLLEKTGGLHPAKYHAGLVRVAREAGAELHDRTRARALEQRRGGGWRVRTSRGDIDADEVLLATNAYADGLAPALQRRVLPIGSFIIATEPLDADLARAVIPRGRMVYDTKHFLFYWRLSPDRRMVFGGRTGLGTMPLARARDLLYREMVCVHPQLAGARVDRSWGGNVAITLDRLPHCGRIPVPGGGSVAYATGCNGTGVALSTWFGFRAAAWLDGEESPPPFAQLPFRPIPLHSARSLSLPAVGWYLRVLDRLGR
jgi:glycine/D-amino acid oxidase-like deaminating enzyme